MVMVADILGSLSPSLTKKIAHRFFGFKLFLF